MSTKTTMVKKEAVEHDWYVVNGEGHIVGRLATKLAQVLMGKHKPTYTPHVDTGDFVIVTNVELVRFSGNLEAHPRNPYYTSKMAKKTYDHYTGYPSGRKVEAAIDIWDKFPDRILREAVRRMLPKSKLGRQMLSKLKLYAGPEHPHQSQQPVEMPAHWLPKKKLG